MNIYKGSRNPYGIKVCYKALYLFVPEQNNVQRPHIEVCDLKNIEKLKVVRFGRIFCPTYAQWDRKN